jgi:hypothetical protein
VGSSSMSLSRMAGHRRRSLICSLMPFAQH